MCHGLVLESDDKASNVLGDLNFLHEGSKSQQTETFCDVLMYGFVFVPRSEET